MGEKAYCSYIISVEKFLATVIDDKFSSRLVFDGI